MHIALCISFSYVGVVVLLINKRETIDIGWSLLILPVLYSLCLSISSNVGIRSYSNPLIISTMWAIIILLDDNIKILRATVFLMLGISFVFKLVVIYGGVTTEQKYLIENGPFKGIHVSKRFYDTYNKDIGNITDGKIASVIREKHLTIIGGSNVLYFENDVRVADKAAYLFDIDKEKKMDSLNYYYSLHKDMKDCYVYIQKDNVLKIKPGDFLNTTLIKETNDYYLIKRN